jgi:hypothetical protein
MKKQILISVFLMCCFFSQSWAQSIEMDKWVQSLPEDPKVLIKKEETPTHYFAFFHLPDNILAIYSCDSKRAIERLKIGKNIFKSHSGYDGKLTDKKDNSVVDEEAVGTDAYKALKEKSNKLMQENDFWHVNYIPIQKDFRGLMKYLYQEEVKYKGETDAISFEWQTALSWVL